MMTIRKCHCRRDERSVAKMPYGLTHSTEMRFSRKCWSDQSIRGCHARANVPKYLCDSLS